MQKIKIDATKCTGCRHCEVACSIQHFDVSNPKKSRIRVYSDIDTGFSYPVISGPFTEAECTSKNIIIFSDEEFDTCDICRASCPSRPWFREPGTDVALKCDFCGDPPDPHCVEWCNSGALTLVEED